MDIPQLEQQGFALSVTQGKSMRPLIWGGQHCVVVVPLEVEPTVGDLLLFQSPIDGCNVVHRLVDIRGGVYITRGDNCLGCESISRDKIIGRVAEVHRISGYRPWHIIPKRKFTVTDPSYLRYSRIWVATWRVRRQYYLFRGHIRGLRARLASIFKKKDR